MAQRTSMAKQEANAILREIRESKGVDNPSGQHYDNVQDLSNALNILSDELYTKATHFLLELIQNADDNTFTTTKPKLVFTTDFSHSELQMRIDCNETGFNQKNVKAICRIGASTKAVVDQKRGFIGEKGIGFKSVFKVADIVHISSGPWSFRFDRREQLGMIAPILESFPSEILPGHTQILLELREASQASQINTELEKIQPELLIFLRKLQVIEIKTPIRHVTFDLTSRDVKDLGGETVTIGKRTLQIHHPSGKRIWRKVETQYMVVRHRVTNITPHEKRPGMTESDIILAFPLNQTKDFERSQYTYAYLPIDDYGFKYLIQADFILVANRESIDYMAGWNTCLRNGIVEAFQKAVNRFNGISKPSTFSNLRYTWPKFLGARYGTSADFWIKLRNNIERDLRTERILEPYGESQKLWFPSMMKYIPWRFRLEGQPLVKNLDSDLRYLAFQYDAGSTSMPPELRLLNVEEMTYRDFFNELSTRLSDDGAQFLESRSVQWHSEVSRILRKSGTQHQMANLSIIPLRDGRWVPPTQKHLYLNSMEINSEVPPGIDIHLVDLNASMDEDRRQFYVWLGIVPCGRAEVCKMIMELHSDLQITRSHEDLVSDVIYIFNTPITEYDGELDKLCLLDHKGVRSRKDLYIDSPNGGFAISKYASNPDSGIKMLHPAYMKAVNQEVTRSRFVKWLVKRTEVCHLPQFMSNRRSTQLFRFFAKSATSDLLILLRDEWDYYISGELHKPGNPILSKGDRESLRSKLSELSAKCTDGRYRSLNQTVLPLQKLRTAGADLHFLEIPEPGNRRWLNFDSLGVITTDNQAFYLRRLVALSSLPVSSSSQKSGVQEIYRQLAARSTSYDEISILCSKFSENPLVFLANLQRWVPLRECVWDAPSCLEGVEKLANRYPDCKSLFCEKLKLGNATINHVVDELESLSPSVTLATRKELLLVLSHYIDKGNYKSSIIGPLKNKDIMPVGFGDPEWKSRLMDYNRDIWYFADRTSLRDSFVGKIWLLEFTIEEVRKIAPLINAMGMKSYLLSAAVVETTETVGDPILDQDQTLRLQKRSHYLVRLISQSKTKPPSMLKQLTTRLQGLKVWRVAALKLVRYIHVTSKHIYGREDQGQVVFRDTDTTLDIYLPINVGNESVIMNCLSEHFIKHCGITDVTYKSLVRPILDYPIGELNKYLERHNLDDLENTNSNSVSDREIEQIEIDIPEAAEESPTLVGEQASSPRFTSSNMQPSMRVLSLRDRIPTFDQTISSVRDAASAVNTAPLPVAAVSELRRHIGNHTVDNHPEPDQSYISETSNSSVILRNDDAAEESREGLHTRDTLNLDAIRSALPDETPEDVTPSGLGRIPRHPFLRQPRTSNSGNQSSPNEGNSAQAIHWKFIGILGESFVDKYMSERLPDWDYSCWTSRNRNEFRHPPFMELERDFTDFTYVDAKKALTRLLVKGGYVRAIEWLFNSEPPITYHLEVKSTNKTCEEPFYMSNNQVDMARGYTLSRTASPSHVYIVFRVYDLNQPDTRPGLKTYVDPWALHIDGGLYFTAMDKYAVTPGEGRV